MKLDEIFAEWESDSKIDRANLEEESLKIPQLHHKYYKIFSNERFVLRGVEQQFKELYKDKYEYFQGIYDQDRLADRGWSPQPLKILRADLPIYLDSDRELAQLKAKIEIQKEKIEFVESIIKSLTNRGFQIKTAVDFIKFKMGA